MTEKPASSGPTWSLTRGDLPVILIAAVVQGWALYGLHLSIDRSVWPSTEPGLLAALYGVAVLAPLTVQMLVQHVDRRLTWTIVAALVAFYFLVGWHYGASVLDVLGRPPDAWMALAFIVCIHWLLIMPFVQARLIAGQWRSRYELLFSNAWNNKLVLAEAAAFTGIFWLLLILWAQLFEMLDIGFFADLFEEPIFIYPVTSLVFGVALKLIGSLERLTKILLEQGLNVLKWLALLAGLILGLFTVALAFALPGMIIMGQRAIAAVWLLWLIAVIVLLANAAYRDGSVPNPYPRAIGLALRCVIPLTVVVAFVAVYALWLRVDQYGLTVFRFWGWVVAGAALLYSVGYASSVLDKGHWMQNIANVNVAVALYLIAVLTLALTPVLSPYRIAANSQFAMAQAVSDDATEAYINGLSSQMSYLRFEAGKYGRDRLEELSRIDNHPRAEEIRREASAALARENRWQPPELDSSMFAQMAVWPKDRTVEPQLAEVAIDELRTGAIFLDVPTQMAGVFADLNNDQTDEFVLVMSGRATLFQNVGGTWRRLGSMASGRYENPELLVTRVREGAVNVEPAAWSDLVVGDIRYRVEPAAR
jgi:hypothetical protein